MTRYVSLASHEQIPPQQLLIDYNGPSRRGFEVAMCSDPSPLGAAARHTAPSPGHGSAQPSPEQTSRSASSTLPVSGTTPPSCACHGHTRVDVPGPILVALG